MVDRWAVVKKVVKSLYLKGINHFYSLLIEVSFETKTQLDDRIVRAAGLKPPIYLGIPGKAQIRKIAEKYYKGEEK